ncbi:hypothetical protein [Micromonospora sp. CPCC 206061]|uniref:hypothetical protein n=1 Tax=Micromonospora sp. CPCC 206061 TaxID=3122410 RepID=UPI002FF28E95
MKKLRAATIAFAAILAGGAVPASAAEAASTIQNPGFEDGLAGWRSTGAAATGGHTGAHHLSHAGKAVTYQRVAGLAPGAYTLRVWVRGGGAASAALAGCGVADRRVDVPRTGPDLWVQVAVSAWVSGRCTITLSSRDWADFDDVTPAGGALDPVRIKGADISHLAKNEAYGAVYRDRSGRRGDAVRLLRANPSSGDGWENQAVFDYSGRALPALRVFGRF